MDLSSLPAEVIISLIAIFIVAAAGCIASLQSWTRISDEKKGVKRAEGALIGDASWDDAYPYDKLKLAVWLRDKGIKPDSHLGDFMRTCWSAWLGGRPASLTELHVLVARRERSHGSTRLSAGIAALLLVFGIVGTLSSIKPVLRDFQFLVAEESQTVPSGKDPRPIDENTKISDGLESSKDASSVAANTELVNTLIHNLGNAFWPSLLALLGTIAVVSCRGLYSLSLHKFTLDLDRFAVDTLIPRYRVPSLSEQYQEVKATLASVTESLLNREGRFHEAVEKLEKLVTGISPAFSGLDAAASASKDAAEKLSSQAQSITEGLSRHLGLKSPIHRAVRGFEAIFEKTDVSLGNLSSVVAEIGQSNTANRKELETAIQALTQSVGRIAEDHLSHQSEAVAALKELKGSMAGIPEVIKSTSEHAVAAGMNVVASSIAQLNAEQKKWHADSAEKLRIATADGLAGVTKAGQNLTTESKRIATAVSDLGKIKTDASAAFKDLADAGKAQISQIGDATKSNVETATDKLTKEAEKVDASVDRLIKLQKETEINNPFGSNNSSGKRSENDGNLAESRKSDQRVPETRPVVSIPTILERPLEVKRIPVPTTTTESTRKVGDASTWDVTPPHKIPENILQNSFIPDSVTANENAPPPHTQAKKWWHPRNPFSKKKS